MRIFQQGRAAARLAALLAAVAPIVAGCSTGSLLGSSASGDAASPSMIDRFSSFFSGPAAPTATQGVGGAATDIDCPSVDVRQGAATLSVNANGREAGAESLRYQVTIGRTARECALVSGNMRIKVGVQGRVILGPAGGPGQIEVPLRYAVVREGPTPQTIVTQLFRIPVTIPADQSTVPFVHVNEDMSFPMPKRQSDFDAYVIYIGFDPDVPKPVEHKAPRKARKKVAG